MASNRSCGTCTHFHDDGRCHRYPPSAPLFEVTFNGVTRYPKASRNGSAMLVFPTVVEADVCGEYAERAAREPRQSDGPDQDGNERPSVKPFAQSFSDDGWCRPVRVVHCPSCDTVVPPFTRWRYCPGCGARFDWEGFEGGER